jgi:carbonic anhydrase
LKEATVTCQEWRDEVVKFHESNRNLRKQVANLMIDDIIQLKNSRIKEVKIVSVKPLLGAYGGVVYKIPKNMIA